MSTPAGGALAALTAGQRERLAALAREAAFPAGARIFEEGEPADRFWVVLEGRAALDVSVPGGPRPVVETLGPGDLLGWSWFFPPYVWHLGAVADGPLRVREFDAAAVRVVCDEDPVLGYALARAVGGVVAHRLKATRMRLLDLYGPRPGGGAP
ncbi:cyclic nucleotide-binding domain-containing protein [Streptacidiphilus sp. ASG 303]|uniref:cyclic nucleotide-binding domain-containing protein n=1 Tax=Streptacidiphilus sp. ASG 303 TaxID=2896847 RepID=UPI001E413F94|nr:cyclic nucleotide-binding domain-containing protein [Streptacidiphilus sp. ASG 303]MCD0485955.1 cyclic nucleotide-binding domain-containing protein [Streptacidiphilus sp. ASG 303]